jgi:hypothetical protein
MPEATSAHQIRDNDNDNHHQVVKDDNWELPNNACAQSDLKAAIQAIQDTVQREISMDDTDGATTMLFQDVQDSLIDLLQRALVPVADDDFQDYVDLYHHHVVPVNLEEEGEVETDEEATQDMEESEDDEIDQDDLLDRKALQEAQQLRSAVRDLAKQVEEARERVLKDSLQTIAAGQGYNHLQLMKTIQEKPKTDTAMDDNVMQDHREALRSAVGDLSSLLKDSHWSELPQLLDSLQSTIDVIQKEFSDDRPMSQTEAAIISRSNSSEEDSTNDWEELLSQPSVALSAADRLARFFQQLE